MYQVNPKQNNKRCLISMFRHLQLIILLLVILVFCFIFSGCNKQNKQTEETQELKLIGTWEGKKPGDTSLITLTFKASSIKDYDYDLEVDSPDQDLFSISGPNINYVGKVLPDGQISVGYWKTGVSDFSGTNQDDKLEMQVSDICLINPIDDNQLYLTVPPITFTRTKQSGQIIFTTKATTEVPTTTETTTETTIETTASISTQPTEPNTSPSTTATQPPRPDYEIVSKWDTSFEIIYNRNLLQGTLIEEWKEVIECKVELGKISETQFKIYLTPISVIHNGQSLDSNQIRQETLEYDAEIYENILIFTLESELFIHKTDYDSGYVKPMRCKLLIEEGQNSLIATETQTHKKIGDNEDVIRVKIKMQQTD